ncbi:MAG: Z1 domain-containing protein, partial [Anaerolineae bacterium]|nr:Z1 domain-containing protein [Anaerolineae bacterium]
MFDIDMLVEEISNSVRGGRTPLQAVKHMSMMMGTTPEADEALKQALKKFEEKTGRIRTLKDPAVMANRELAEWYAGPSPDDKFWNALNNYLLNKKKWNPKAFTSLDDASTRIVSLLQPPGKPEIKTKGLVVGYVQSGKTANFTAVIAKAADVNYKFFIVLSGITNSLRSQTQKRLETELSELNPQHWVTLTTRTDDFRKGAAGNVDAFLTDHQNLRVLCVIKKNATVLKRLLEWLDGASNHVLASCPVLIIDDEADQASVNASKDAENKRTVINKRLIEILKRLPKAAYVGYTATPFANVLIDPTADDLYPKDFIVSLPKPEDYFGAERIFGRERLWNEETGGSEIILDMIRVVPNDEVQLLQPGRKQKDVFEPELSTSLQEAITYFWMAAAARMARGQSDQHISMLIHSTMFTVVHDSTKPLIENLQKKIVRQIQRQDELLLSQMRMQWNNEQQNVQSQEFGELPLSFEEIEPHILDVIQNTLVIVDNYKSQQRLSYEGDALIQIVIGGNALSRGLTLEGLTVSYFIRTASAYDTLLQMGRWFGYRKGYADIT